MSDNNDDPDSLKIVTGMDLVPWDFCLLPQLTRLIKGWRFATIEELKTESMEELKKLYQ